MVQGGHAKVGGHASCNTDLVNLSHQTEPSCPETPGIGTPRPGTSGVVLLVLKHYLMCRCQPGTLELLGRKLGPEQARALMAPDPGCFYPASLVDGIAEGVCLYLTDGRPESFAELVHEIALFGFRHGFRHAVELGDTRRVLDSVPNLWRHLERDHPGVTVAHGPTESVLRIPSNPRLSCELRQQAIVAVLSALIFAATGRDPAVSVHHDGVSALEVTIGRSHS